MIAFKLWEHQRKCIEQATALPGFALLWEPGTGKTLTTIQMLRHIYAKHGKILPTLVLAPVIVLENWREEFHKFSKVNPKQVLSLYGPVRSRIEKFKRSIQTYEGNIIVITNYEGIVTNPEYFNLLYNWCPKVVVYDESHKIKNHASKRTKLTTKISDRADIKYLLTGTPILNSPMDIFSQYRAMDNGKTFGTNFYIFRSKYFYDKNAGMPKAKYFPNWQIRKGSIDEMNRLIYTKAMRVIKSECLDLPPLVKKIVKVPLSHAQEKLYTQMKNDFIAFLEQSNHVTVAQLAVTKALRLQQIVTGFIKTDAGIEVSLGPTPRQEALKELLEEITPAGKVIIWCVFKQNYEQVRKICIDLDIKFVEVHGEIANKEKYSSVDKFNSDNDVRVFIGHPASLGVGINLCSSSYSIYYSRTFSLENDIQSEARNYRSGSEIHEKVTRIDIVAENTIDELVLDALEKKVQISESMLKDWRKLL